MAKVNLDQFYGAGNEEPDDDLDDNLNEDGNNLSNIDDNIDDNVDDNIVDNNQPTLVDMLKMTDDELKEMGVDDPKAWKSYQKKLVRQKNDFDKERSSHAKEMAEIKGTVDTLMKMMQNGNAPAAPKPVELIKPVLPKEPLRPADFNLNDAQTDTTSASYKYMLDSEKYDRDFRQYMLDVSEYNTKITQQGFEELRESHKTITAEKQQQAAQAKFLSDFQSEGATYEEAIGMWNDYIVTKQGFEPKNMLALYRAQKGTGRNNGKSNQNNNGYNSGYNNRSQNFDKRRSMVNNNLPPGVGRNTPKADDSQNFMSGIGKGSAKIDNLYSVSKK